MTAAKRKRRQKAVRTCSIPGCLRPHFGHGWCNTHYMRWWKYGRLDLLETTPAKEKPCSIPGCHNRQRARGYCGTHWLRWRKHGDVGAGRQIIRQLKTSDDFWSWCVRLPSGCWEWARSVTSNGYGNAHFNGRQDSAHRIAFRIATGGNIDGLVVCHSCDNKKCINPDHLFVGTQLDNMRDRKAKGHYGAYRLNRNDANSPARWLGVEVPA